MRQGEGGMVIDRGTIHNPHTGEFEADYGQDYGNIRMEWREYDDGGSKIVSITTDNNKMVDWRIQIKKEMEDGK